MHGIAASRSFAIASGAALIAGAGCTQAGDQKTKFAYVASCGNDTVVQFKVGHKGLLKPNSPATAGAGACPGGLATVTLAGKQFVYVTNGNDDTISQYSIAANGTL